MLKRRVAVGVFLLLAMAAGWAAAASIEHVKIVFCRQVEEREPVDAATKFPADVGWVYCHTTVRNVGEETQIHHDWYFKKQLIGRQTLAVGASQNWRTYSSKPVSPAWVGKWEVVIKSAEEKELGRASFEIVPVKE